MIAEDIMYDGLLPRTLKEGIATVVSRTNECSYCANSHANAYTISGGKEEDAEACMLLNFSEFNENEKAALRFAHKATLDKNSIKQKDIDLLKEYFSDSEIVEISVVVQQFMGYNSFVTMLGLELEDTNPFKEKELMI